MKDKYCTHHECRLDAVAELLWMAKRLDRPDLKAASVTVMEGQVRCRHVPFISTTGAPQAPFSEGTR